MSSNYLLTKRQSVRDFLSHMEEDDDDEEIDASWRQKAQRLQARRWRKIKHQLV